MNVKFINPFVEAAFEVLQAETSLKVSRGELGLEKTPYVTDDATVIISLVGRVEGTVFYSMNERAAVSLAARMMGESLTTFNSLAQSGVAELGNVITGRASVKLSEAGYEATISPPTLLLGKGATISTLDFARLVLPLNSECGAVTIHLALREGMMHRGVSAAALPVPARPAFQAKV
ncbi:MAG: chemotaxis protein CheX [Chloroflexi bacterium]|nr:chemotaxis protein CheX [Chloroflexota bacterium]